MYCILVADDVRKDLGALRLMAELTVVRLGTWRALRSDEKSGVRTDLSLIEPEFSFYTRIELDSYFLPRTYKMLVLNIE